MNRLAKAWSSQGARLTSIAVLTLVAAALRSGAAFNGGIWADEAFFLKIVHAPSWATIMDFLRWHESHPPFFYGVTRLWMMLAGSSDIALLWLPVIIGTLIVPVAYLVATSLYGNGVGLIAAALSALSPPLVEHSAQLRPYGLLPLLVLASSYWMVVALVRGGLARWIAYVVTTLAFLYTHNWTWVIAAGQHVAVVCALLTVLRPGIVHRLSAWAAAWLAIAIGYLPWAATLLFQATHAGHPGYSLESVGDVVMFVMLALFTVLETVLVGGLPKTSVPPIMIGSAVAIAAALSVARIQRTPVNAEVTSETKYELEGLLPKTTRLVFSVVPLAAFVFASALCLFSNFLFPRCLTMPVPLLLIVFASFIHSRLLRPSPRSSFAPAVAAMVGFLFVLSGSRLYDLVTSPRSNARELAAFVGTEIGPTDFLIVAPEWYSTVFDHYFPPSIEQVDFPYEGRSGLIDFSNVWKRTTDPIALEAIRRRIVAATLSKRRVWLITSQQYLRDLTPGQTKDATNERHPGLAAAVRVELFRNMLTEAYGRPLLYPITDDRTPRYDVLRAYLWSPPETVAPRQDSPSR